MFSLFHKQKKQDFIFTDSIMFVWKLIAYRKANSDLLKDDLKLKRIEVPLKRSTIKLMVMKLNMFFFILS